MLLGYIWETDHRHCHVHRMYIIMTTLIIINNTGALAATHGPLAAACATHQPQPGIGCSGSVARPIKQCMYTQWVHMLPLYIQVFLIHVFPHV